MSRFFVNQAGSDTPAMVKEAGSGLSSAGSVAEHARLVTAGSTGPAWAEPAVQYWHPPPGTDLRPVTYYLDYGTPAEDPEAPAEEPETPAEEPEAPAGEPEAPEKAATPVSTGSSSDNGMLNSDDAASDAGSDASDDQTPDSAKNSELSDMIEAAGQATMREYQPFRESGKSLKPMLERIKTARFSRKDVQVGLILSEVVPVFDRLRQLAELGGNGNPFIVPWQNLQKHTHLLRIAENGIKPEELYNIIQSAAHLQLLLADRRYLNQTDEKSTAQLLLALNYFIKLLGGGIPRK